MKNIKNIFAVAVLFITMTIVSAFTISKNGKVIMIVSLEVKNFTEWKKMFDAGAALREKAGIKVLNICSSVDNENHVLVIEEAENAKAANGFISILKSKQKDGDMSKLDVKLYDEAE
ncbi:MAG: hypothetical protein H7141_13715 [Burkholderiales bacterium]|nr:hypothetical protein [Bacteroidia bacterium]